MLRSDEAKCLSVSGQARREMRSRMTFRRAARLSSAWTTIHGDNVLEVAPSILSRALVYRSQCLFATASMGLRAQMLDDSLDRAVLTTGVPAFENDQHLVTVLDDVPLNLDELDLQVA